MLEGVSFRGVVGRLALFAAWALVGAVAGYGALYAFTPFGLMVLGACLFAGLALPEAGGSRTPEIIGLAAGPGVFLLVAATVGHQTDVAAAIAGAAVVSAATSAYVLVGRGRCART
jgi:hypothetical protein